MYILESGFVISVTKIPAVVCLFIAFVNMLSIRMAVSLITLVGVLIRR